MANEVWKGVYHYFFGHSKQLSLNRFFDLRTPSMRKGCDRETMGKKQGGKEILLIIVATTSLPAVNRPNAERSCQKVPGNSKPLVLKCMCLFAWEIKGHMVILKGILTISPPGARCTKHWHFKNP